MKNILSAVFIYFCFSNTIGQTSVKNTPTPNTTITNELLQGKWSSPDDKMNFLMFANNLRKESSDGMKTWDEEVFVLSGKCLNESDKENEMGTIENATYISCLDSDLCWSIVEVNKDFLTLIYMGRGNTLKYRRVK
jgi:hypothetical protein